MAKKVTRPVTNITKIAGVYCSKRTKAIAFVSTNNSSFMIFENWVFRRW